MRIVRYPPANGERGIVHKAEKVARANAHASRSAEAVETEHGAFGIGGLGCADFKLPRGFKRAITVDQQHLVELAPASAIATSGVPFPLKSAIASCDGNAPAEK